MSLIYACEDNGRRHLVRIECDQPGCLANVKPSPDIVTSGWVRNATDRGPGTDRLEWYYCPAHAT